MRAAYVSGAKSVLRGFVWIKGREDKKCIVRLLFHRKIEHLPRWQDLSICTKPYVVVLKVQILQVRDDMKRSDQLKERQCTLSQSNPSNSSSFHGVESRSAKIRGHRLIHSFTIRYVIDMYFTNKVDERLSDDGD